MRVNELPSIERLNELFILEKIEGVLFHKWRTENNRHDKRWNACFAFQRAGWSNGNGYRHLRIDGKLYLTHRIIYQMIHGDLDIDLQIDHIDGDPTNCRPQNLRKATHSQNKTSTRRPSNNTSGVVGVYFHKRLQKYLARGQKNKKSVHIGCFRTLEEAKEARMAYEQAHFGDFLPDEARRNIPKYQ